MERMKRPTGSGFNKTKPQRAAPRAAQDTKNFKSKPSDRSVNPLKKRSRDLTRLLKHTETLPADVKIGYERELASCHHDLEIAQGKLRRNQMIKKYHKVRFFERQKATRFHRQAQKQLAGAPESQDKAALEDEVHKCEVDLNYTMFFPLDQIYISLYASAKDEKGKGKGNGASTADRSHAMWKTVEEAMANGTLQTLREIQTSIVVRTSNKNAMTAAKGGKRNGVAGHTGEPASTETISGTASKGNSKVQTAGDSDEDDETGGAFFE